MWQDFWSDLDQCSSSFTTTSCATSGCFVCDDHFHLDLIQDDDYDSESTWSADQDFVSATDSLSTITLTSNCTCRYSTSKKSNFSALAQPLVFYVFTNLIDAIFEKTREIN